MHPACCFPANLPVWGLPGGNSGVLENDPLLLQVGKVLLRHAQQLNKERIRCPLQMRSSFQGRLLESPNLCRYLAGYWSFADVFSVVDTLKEASLHEVRIQG